MGIVKSTTTPKRHQQFHAANSPPTPNIGRYQMKIVFCVTTTAKP
jgi:hypothetical protein